MTIEYYLRTNAGLYYIYTGSVGTTATQTAILRVFVGKYSQNDLVAFPGLLPINFTGDARLIINKINRALVEDEITPDAYLWVKKTITGTSEETPVVTFTNMGQLLFDDYADDVDNLTASLKLEMAGAAS